MKIYPRTQSGLTVVELLISGGLVGVLGLIIYSLLNIGTILGAKNTAVNTAHQQARVAMIEMIGNLHSSVSLPQLAGTGVGTQAGGISFQQWSMGPFKIIADTAPLPGSQNFVQIKLPTSTSPLPAVNQRLIVPTHQIEGDITAVSGSWDNLTITLANIPAQSPPAPSPIGTNLPVQINGTTSTVGDIVCYITDRCSYNVVQVSPGPPAQYKLQWTKQGTRDIVNDITNPTPFSIPTTPAGALYYRFVAAINLSTSDPHYSNRGYKSANILLNGQVPFKSRLTTYQ